MRALLVLLLLFGSLGAKEAALINPFTDICWECLFPLVISGQNASPGHPSEGHSKSLVCYCSGTPPKAGLPLSFFEPGYLVDVTRTPYKMLGLGGLRLGKAGLKHRGAVRKSPSNSMHRSFYQVHLYRFPVIRMLELFDGFDCLAKETKEVEIAYMSEYDPLWSDDRLAFLVNPEAGCFSSKLAHLACLADCAASNASKPQDKLFWCAGCEGSLYPFTGTVSHHAGALQASSLLVQRLLAKMHRSYLLKGYGKNDFCEAKYMPLIKKSLYKTQLLHPVAQRRGPCPSLGKSDLFWGAGKSFPKGGEDFVYLIWRKKQCCLDAVKKGALHGL